VRNPYGLDHAIRVTGDGAEDASVGIFDAQGRLLRNLVATSRSDGEAVFSWDGRTSRGQEVPVSAVFVRAESGGRTVTRMVVLFR
jgi:hypothetical protein